MYFPLSARGASKLERLKVVLSGARHRAILIGLAGLLGSCGTALGEVEFLLTSPAAGSTLAAGSTTRITWTSNGAGGSVYLALVKGGVHYASIAQPPTNAGGYDWHICSFMEAGSDYSVQAWVWPENEPGSGWYFSPGAFTITNSTPHPVPALTLTSLTGGQTIQAGSTQTITWSSTNPTGTVDAYLHRSGSWHEEWIGSAPTDEGRLDWQVCAAIGDGTDYYISLSGTDECQRYFHHTGNSFSIAGSANPGSITVTAPAAGETWTAGTTRTITWNSTNAIGDVYIYLYQAGQYGSWIGSASVSDGQFMWTICPGIGDGTDYSVEVVQYGTGGCPDVFAESPAFAITGSSSLAVTHPSTGETWTAGSTHAITWTSTNATGDVDIYLYKAGQYGSWIGSASVSDGQFMWTICPSIGDGTDYSVQVAQYSDGDCHISAESQAFAITGSSPPPTLTVTHPSVGETWTAGSTHAITWTGADATGDVDIYLYQAGQYGSWIGSASVSDGQFMWTICPGIGDGTDYSVEVVQYGTGGCPDVFAESPAFAITGSSSLAVTHPSTGETWTAGSTHAITWTSTNATGDVYIQLYKNGTYQSTIGIAAVSAGQFAWTICPSIGDGTTYSIGFWQSGSGGCPGLSAESSSFAITGSLPPPTLTVTSPAGGETWTAGTTQAITWTSTNPTGNVSISLHRAGQYYSSWIGNAPMSAGQFAWTLGSAIGDGTDYYVQVGQDDAGGCSVSARSQVFAITGSLPPPTLTLTSPVGGETWAAGTTQMITWDSTNATGDVYILLMKGQSYSVIGVAPMSDDQFTANICPAIGDGTDYRIHIMSLVSPASAVSQPFTITGSTSLPPVTLALTRPVGGETWSPGSSQRVSWQSTNPVGHVFMVLSKAGAFLLPIGFVPTSDGHFDWQIPATLSPGSDYGISMSVSDCGSSLGPGATVTSAPFSIVSTMLSPADFDGDGDVDADDHDRFEACATGPGISYAPGSLPSGCLLIQDDNGYIAADFNRDRTVDQIDFAVFQQYYNGPMVPSPADFDGDGDVDKNDLDRFEACASGPGIGYPQGCDAKDLDHDGDVDQSDFAAFQRCYSGENVPADPNCSQ